MTNTTKAVVQQSWPRFVGTLLLLLAVIAAVTAVAVAALPFHQATNRDGRVMAMYVGTGAGELLALGLLVALLRRHGKSLSDLGFGRRTTRSAIVAGLVVALAYAAVTAAVLPTVPGNVMALTGLKLLSIVATVLIAGTVEETICRGYVITTVQRLGGGRVLQVFLSGLTYSVGHPSGLFALLFTFLLGAALAVVYIFGNHSLTPVIIAHMLVNLIIEPGLLIWVADSQMS